MEKSYGCLNLKVRFCNSTCINVAIAASQMQAKIPARVKVDKITYWLAYRRVQIEILVVGKEHLLHLINGQTSQKRSASFQPFKFNGISVNLRWHAPKSWQLEIHFHDAPNGSVAHSKRFGNLTGTFARTWLVLLTADHVADSSDVLRSSNWFGRPLPDWRVTADPILVMRRQIVFRVFKLHCFAGYLDLMALAAPSPCSCRVWICILSLYDILPIANII